MLVGICGPAGAGKDELARILMEEGVVSRRQALADPLKRVVNALFGWDERHAFGKLKEVECLVNIDEERYIEAAEATGLARYVALPEDLLSIFYTALLPASNTAQRVTQVSPRRAYQVFGTDVCRKHLRDDIWLALAPITDVVVPDIRFLNEAQWVHQHGGVLLRPLGRQKTVASHESERFFADIEKAGLIDIHLDNTGTLDNLRRQVCNRLCVA